MAVPVFRDRVAEEPPEIWPLDPVEPAAQFRHEILERDAQGQRIVGQVPAFLDPFAPFFHRDDVAQAAAAQRIGHQMPPRPHEDPRHGGDARLGRDRRAPGDLAGEEGRDLPVQGLTHLRMQPVGADQDIRLHLGPVGHVKLRRALTQRHVGDLLQKPDFGPRRARRLGQDGDQVGAVDEAEMPPLPAIAKVKRDDTPAAFAVDQVHPLCRDADPVQRRAKAQGGQDPRAVGRDLQACADLPYLGRLFQHSDMRALQRQRPRHGQPRDPGAENRHPAVVQHVIPRKKKGTGAIKPGAGSVAAPRTGISRRGEPARAVRDVPALPASWSRSAARSAA